MLNLQAFFNAIFDSCRKHNSIKRLFYKMLKELPFVIALSTRHKLTATLTKKPFLDKPSNIKMLDDRHPPVNRVRVDKATLTFLSRNLRLGNLLVHVIFSRLWC